jgi:hypothetical protein
MVAAEILPVAGAEAAGGRWGRLSPPSRFTTPWQLGRGLLT